MLAPSVRYGSEFAIANGRTAKDVIVNWTTLPT